MDLYFKQGSKYSLSESSIIMPIKRNRKWLYLLGGVIYSLFALLAISIALMPTITRFAFKHWLEQQHLQGDIGQIGLALNTGTVTVIDAEIHDGEVPLFKLGKLQVRNNLRDLFDHKLTIEQVTLKNTHIQIEQRQRALVVAGINLNQMGTPPAKPVREKPVNSQPWTLQLDKVHITRLDTCFTTTETRQPLNICNQLGKFSWNGNVAMTTSNPSAIKSAGTLSISNLAIQDKKQNIPLLQLDSLKLANIKVNGLDQIGLGSLDLGQLKMLPNRDASSKHAPTLGIAKLLINTISFNKMTDLNIGAINIDGISSYIKLNTDSSIASLKPVTEYRPIETRDKKQNTTSKPTGQSPPVRIRIGKINVASSKSFILEDTHSKPAITQRIDHFSLALGAIDSNKPDQRSKLSMQFKYGKYGKVKVNGTVQAFAAKPSMDLHANIVGLNLNRVSPYTRELLQHKIKSGELSARLVIKIKQGKLDSEAKLTLVKFYVSNLSGKEADKYQKSLGIPLSAALSLLRDKNDTIRIDLPVTGDIEKPDFSLNDIIATVSAKAIRVAIVNYYATLGLVQLVTGAYDLVTALRFEPLVFSPGQTTLTDTSRKALDKFATMLVNRPQVHLIVCGHATLDDQIKLFPKTKPSTESTTTTITSKPVPLTEKQLKQLNKLALARGEQVKQYLVKKKGVAADRLIECNPEYKPDDKHSPYVELHI
ncbi:MAG: DUF748 domain-containing protein [Gammaproteobacteria bacterium]